MRAATLLLGLVTAQRLGELALSRRNTRELLARGAVEAAPGHYPAIVALHAAWLAVLWSGRRPPRLRRGPTLAFLLLQGLRAWTLASLGRRWTTRIIVLPGEPLVRRGPYRLLPHPNYLVVAGEILALPLALGRPRVAALFSALNAAVLTVRIEAEGRALAAAPGVQALEPTARRG